MRLNPDKELVENIKAALRVNDYYCPCGLFKTDEYKCPCKEMREENKCHCGLFVND